MTIARWKPPVAPTRQEQFLLKRLDRVRKLLGFLRVHRHELFDDAFQDELASMYRTTGAGKDALPPAMMAMAMLVQGYLGISDAEMVELTVVELRVQMDDRQFDHLSIGNSQVALHEHRHGHHRGRQRVFPGTRCAIHRRQLILKRVVKQLVPMHSKKPQELSDAIQALQQELLLPCRCHRRFPTRDRHLHASSGRWPTSASDHKSHQAMHRKK